MYYEISSMEGSDDACAIVCISGSGAFHRPLALYIDAEVLSGPRLDLERYPQAASLAKNATSIRLFHLRSIETYERKLSFSDSRELSHKLNPSPQRFSTPFRGAQSTRGDDSPSQVHYHERPSTMELRSVYFLSWHQTATYNLAPMYFPRFLERYHRVLSCRIICRRPRKNLISMLVRLRSPPNGGRFWNNLCWSTRTLAKIGEALDLRRVDPHITAVQWMEEFRVPPDSHTGFENLLWPIEHSGYHHQSARYSEREGYA